jgi:hypothetical protein
MTDRINHVEKLERIMEQLADSVLELSDEAILAEITESGGDPQQEAECTRSALRQALQALDNAKKRPKNDQYAIRRREASR